MRLVIAASAALATLVSGGVATAAGLHAAPVAHRQHAPVAHRQHAAPVGRRQHSAPVAHRHTVRVVVRPVHSDGTPVAGWKVLRERIPAFSCRGGASIAAVDPNIVYCGFPSTNTLACWKSRHHTVLCVRDPRVHKLYRIRYQGAFQPAKPMKHPSPLSFALIGGNYCTSRDGGTWPSVKHHPRWYATYICAKGAVYGGGRDGIDRSVSPWRVHLVLSPFRPTIRERRIGTAYYVGTAA